MNKTYRVLTLTAALLMAVGCKLEKQQANSATFDDTANEMEAASSAMTAVMDDQQGESFASDNRSRMERMAMPILNEILPEAVASNDCARPALQACNTGVKSATYNECSLGSRGATYSGYATLSFSDSSCQLLSSGDHVTRTYDVTFTGPRKLLNIKISSETDQNYLGETHSGGGRLTKTSSGHELEVLGRNQSVTFNGNTVASQSIKTTSPIQVTGGLRRASRVVNGGELVVSRNIAKYKAKFVADNVQYSSSCCHPVSGSFDITYEGSKTGTAKLTFLGCGSAQYEKDDLKRDITLSYCH